eukprot:365679-Chlamydomonas_euryale.AAC.15
MRLWTVAGDVPTGLWLCVRLVRRMCASRSQREERPKHPCWSSLVPWPAGTADTTAGGNSPMMQVRPQRS